MKFICAIIYAFVLFKLFKRYNYFLVLYLALPLERSWLRHCAAAMFFGYAIKIGS